MRPNHFSKKLLFLIILSFILVSCANTPKIIYITASSTATQSDTETPQPQPTQTFPLKPTQKSTAKPVSTPTSLQTNTFTPTRSLNDPAFHPKNIQELQSQILFLLNQGKEISEISNLFYQQEPRKAQIDSYTLDFNGDNKDEMFLACSLFLDNFELKNLFLIVKEDNEQFHVEHSWSETAQYGPNIHIVDDLNQNNLPDLVFSRPFYGQGTGADIFITRWEKDGHSIRRIAATDNLIDSIRIGKIDASGNKQIIITGYQPVWGSSGPGRTVEETFSFNKNKYEITNSLFLPSKYRIHVLQDAQIAYDAKDENQAVKLWMQAATDITLENYPSMWIDDDVPEKYQPAYAMYRLYTYYLVIGDTKKADKLLSELENKYPQDTPGSEFIGLSYEAKRLLKVSRSPSLVCEGIYEYLNSTDELVNFLMNHWYWGDHNINIVEFCPLRNK